MNKLFVSFIVATCLLPANFAFAGEGSSAHPAAASSSSSVSASETSAAKTSVSASCESAVPTSIGFLRRFCIQHPWIPHLVKTCGVGAGAYALSKVFTSSTLNAWVAVGIVEGAFLAWSCLCDATMSSSDFLASLIYNPLLALKYAYDVNKQFVEQLKKDKIDYNMLDLSMLGKYNEILKRYESRCPILSLGECTENGWWPCVLSRTYQPRYREIYEERTVSALCAKIDEAHGTPVQYVSFGSGGLFQDLVILVKTLAKKPDAMLNIHLIDTNFTPYVAFCNLRDGSRMIIGGDDDLGSVMSQLKEIVRRDLGAENESDHQLEQLIVTPCLIIGTRLKQLASWLTKMFPRAHLTFYAHDNAESYVNYIIKQKISYPDVLTTADIDDDGSCMQDAHRCYVTLCMKTLRNNPRACNIWLAKVWVNGGEDGWYASKDVELVNVSLTAGSGTEEIKFKNKDGSDVLIYKKAERI